MLEFFTQRKIRFHRHFLRFKGALGILPLLPLLVLSTTRTAWASVYGEGHYGSGVYNTGETLSPAGAPTCGDAVPGQPAPWLYSAVPNSNRSIRLYFTDSGEPYDHYAVEYGTRSGQYTFGATDIGGKGMRTALIQALSTNTTYYFRVRAGNGCATGAWSNEISAKTLASLSTSNLQVDVTQLESSSEPTSNTTDSQTSAEWYQLRLKIVDRELRPVQDASITLDTSQQQAKTSEDGVVMFDDIEPGEHKLTIGYHGYTQSETIYVQGNNSVFEMTIRIEPPGNRSPTRPMILVGFVVVLVTIASFSIFSRRRASRSIHSSL